MVQYMPQKCNYDFTGFIPEPSHTVTCVVPSDYEPKNWIQRSLVTGFCIFASKLRWGICRLPQTNSVWIIIFLMHCVRGLLKTIFHPRLFVGALMYGTAFIHVAAGAVKWRLEEYIRIAWDVNVLTNGVEPYSHRACSLLSDFSRSKERCLEECGKVVAFLSSGQAIGVSKFGDPGKLSDSTESNINSLSKLDTVCYTGNYNANHCFPRLFWYLVTQAPYWPSTSHFIVPCQHGTL